MHLYLEICLHAMVYYDGSKRYSLKTAHWRTRNNFCMSAFILIEKPGILFDTFFYILFIEDTARFSIWFCKNAYVWSATLSKDISFSCMSDNFPVVLTHLPFSSAQAATVIVPLTISLPFPKCAQICKLIWNLLVTSYFSLSASAVHTAKRCWPIF